MRSLQDWIHKLEEGAGVRYLKFTVIVLLVAMLALLYNFRVCRNFNTQEAMDTAQLARNISEGKGYTTLFIRPLSIYLLQNHADAGNTNLLAVTAPDAARLKTAHPDLANPPVYPLVLAGLMKALPFHFAVNTQSSFWSNNGAFWRYQPDFLIALFNEILLLVVVTLTFLIARKLFDQHVAWLSALLVLGCEMLWKFSASGLSTMLLLIIFLGLTWSALKFEESGREPQPNFNRPLTFALITGVLVGLGMLTRYAFGWLIIPLVVFLFLFGGQKRSLNAVIAFVAFAIVISPWIIRNFVVSGTPFGTAGFAIVEGTVVSPEFQLERSLHPDFSNSLMPVVYFYKLLANLRGIFQNDLLKLGGSWASILFLAGLLLSFRSAAIRRMRYFLLMCLATLIVVQALGRTQLAEESPDINSENLLILLAPLVFIYGASFFFTFLEQMQLPMAFLRPFVIGAFALLCCLPMVFALLPPKKVPVTFPPYYPPDAQQISGWMKENELTMSDVPWAVAWYGNRQCVWLTRDAHDDLFAINDYMKPVQGIYLTPVTMDGKFFSEMARAGQNSWGRFLVQVGIQNQFPKDFPLHSAKVLVSGLFLADWDRWKLSSNNQSQ
ncbi:MAG TPA: glycosyltransferase family 39 protein [Verrucomicrobiae bacterium]|nr:glycosyltransferase family 39 protein [Verrucomicrobiae bacterium]